MHLVLEMFIFKTSVSFFFRARLTTVFDSQRIQSQYRHTCFVVSVLTPQSYIMQDDLFQFLFHTFVSKFQKI